MSDRAHAAISGADGEQSGSFGPLRSGDLYYLEGVDWTARQATATTTALLDLFHADRARVSSMVRVASTLRVYEALQSKVIVSIRRVAEDVKITVPTATAALKRLEELGIAREITGRNYGRLFAYDRQLQIINE